MLDGLFERIVSGNIGVLRLYYFCDPGKRPGTDAGDDWIKNQSSGYPGGTKSSRWQKEMLIKYGAMGGTKLIPEWDTIKKTVVIDPVASDGYRLYSSYEHGWRSPSAYHVHGINQDGHRVTFWEFYDHHVPVSYIAKIIKGESVRLPDGRQYTGNPYHDQEIMKIADPQIWAEDQQMSSNEMKSIAQLFQMEGVFFAPGNHGGDTTVAEWLLGDLWLDPTKPKYQITTACPKLIWEIGRLRHKELSAKVSLNKEQPEGLVKKEDHAWDSTKMWFLKFPPAPSVKKAVQKPGSFDWWREQTKRASRGEAVMSYHRESV